MSCTLRADQAGNTSLVLKHRVFLCGHAKRKTSVCSPFPAQWLDCADTPPTYAVVAEKGNCSDRRVGAGSHIPNTCATYDLRNKGQWRRGRGSSAFRERCLRSNFEGTCSLGCLVSRNLRLFHRLPCTRSSRVEEGAAKQG
jgi:hypothetical protein